MLQTGPGASDRNKDVRHGKSCAVIAFNTFVYSEESGPAKENERTKVTPAEMRDLTDAMLQTFLAELSQVNGLQIQPLSNTAGSKSYARFPGRPGTKIQGFALDKPLGLMAAPANLKYLRIANSTGTNWIRSKTQGLTLSAMVGKVLGAEPTDGSEHEDASLLSYKLKMDFALIVNNRVRLIRGYDGKWTTTLELVEVLAAGSKNLKKYAYSKHVTGEFIDGTAAPKADPVQPAMWKLMAWKPDGKVEKRTEDELAKRDFATNPFWRPIAGPYKRIAGVFREDLNKIRR